METKVEKLKFSNADAFDPTLYAEIFYGGSNYPSEADKTVFLWYQDQAYDIFKQGTLNGRKMLDIGTGPVVYPVITASKYFDEIYLSDYALWNIESLEGWRTGKSDHMSYLMNYYAQKEGGGISGGEINQQVLDKLKGTVEVDVRKPNPLSGTVLEHTKFDVISSCACLNVATVTPTIKGFAQSLKNMSVLLQEGGQCVVQSFLDATYFLCGDIKIHGLNSTPKEIQNAFTEAGYVIQRWESLTLDQECVFTDGRMLFSVVAKKV